jgi:adenosylhomocysteine nucleosidase
MIGINMIAGIIGAMEPEVALIKQQLKNANESTVAGFTFYQGTLDDSQVVLVQSGIGKVAAALATAALVEHFSPDYVINTGSAGGFDAELNIGDIVIANEVRYHDVNVTAFGYEIGQLPGNPAAFSANAQLVAAAEKAINQLGNIKAKIGLITTGDTFMTAEADIALARANFPTMAAVEMEGAAIAQTCHFLQVPFAIIRSLSDIAGKESPTSFEAYLETASINSSKMVQLMLAELKSVTLN